MTDPHPQPTPRPARDVPPALTDFDAVAAALRGRRPALFLDYDGTLTPIVDRPDLAVLSEAARATVARVAARLPVAVISGRDRADVARLVGIDTLTVAGSHGFDIAAPGGRVIHSAAGGDVGAALDAVETDLHRRLDSVPGSLIERKKFSIAAHYRLVPPGRADEVRQAVAAVVAAHPGLKAKPGKMVLEIQPDIDWHKGRAVLWLLETLGLDRDDTVPVFIGDDVTDEDAFRTLHGRGLGFVVADADEDRPTVADFRLDDPDAVLELLERLAR